MSSVDGSITIEKVPTTPYPLVFLRCRTIAFCAITFFSFAWVILLSIVVFMQWEFMDKAYQSTIMVMITVYAITVILLLVMLTRRFRAWLDAARFSLLLVAHIGVSAAFAHYSRRFSCPQPTVEDRNVCRVLILYILISSWLLPLLIAIYTSALGVMALYRWHLARPFDASGYFDAEKDSLDRKLNLKHKSQVSSFLVGPPPPSPTPIAARFSTQLDIPNRFATMPTPTTVDFSGSSYYSASPVRATHASPAVTPTSMGFPADSQPYLVPTPPNGSPTQLPYLMPPSPNLGPQPYSAALSDTQPYSTPPGNPLSYSTPLRNPQSYSAPSRNPYLTIPSNPGVQSYLATPSHAQPYSMPRGNPYLTPNSSSRQTYSTPSNHRHSQLSSPPLHNPYLMPPLPHHWNSNPPPTRSQHYSVTTLHESIPEETSSTSGDSDYQKRASTRLSKPSRSSRLPSL